MLFWTHRCGQRLQEVMKWRGREPEKKQLISGAAQEEKNTEGRGGGRVEEGSSGRPGRSLNGSKEQAAKTKEAGSNQWRAGEVWDT